MSNCFYAELNLESSVMSGGDIKNRRKATEKKMNAFKIGNFE